MLDSENGFALPLIGEGIRMGFGLLAFCWLSEGRFEAEAIDIVHLLVIGDAVENLGSFDVGFNCGDLKKTTTGSDFFGWHGLRSGPDFHVLVAVASFHNLFETLLDFSETSEHWHFINIFCAVVIPKWSAEESHTIERAQHPSPPVFLGS